MCYNSNIGKFVKNLKVGMPEKCQGAISLRQLRRNWFNPRAVYENAGVEERKMNNYMKTNPYMGEGG